MHKRDFHSQSPVAYQVENQGALVKGGTISLYSKSPFLLII